MGEQWQSFEGLQGFEGFKACTRLNNNGEALQGFKCMRCIGECFDFHDVFTVGNVDGLISETNKNKLIALDHYFLVYVACIDA